MKILLKSATVVDEKSPFHLQKKDILLEDGQIIQIENNIEQEATRVITHKDLHISPSWFDADVSFGEPGFEERENIANGLKVAEKSGFGDIALAASNQPCTDSKNILESLRDKSAHTTTKLHPIACLSKGRNGKELAELFDLYQAGARVFSDDVQAIENPNLLKLALQYTKSFGGRIASFPLEKQVANNAQVHESPNATKLGFIGMPSLAETLQIHRDLAVLKYTGGQLHIPCVSTAEGIQLIQEAKAIGANVTCSVALHHLFFNDECLFNFDANYKVFPPLREESDVLALREAVKNDTVNFVTTQHHPINLELKELDFTVAAAGSIGLESAFGALNLLFDKEIAVKMLTRGKTIFNINQPIIQEKARGKFTLFTTQNEYIFMTKHIQSKSKNSLFLGQKLKGNALEII